jgi:hypothetical protein
VSNVYSYGIHKDLAAPQLFFLVMLDESAKQLGVDDLVDLAAIIVGWPYLSTRRKPAGTTAGTSIASRVARRHLDFEIKARILPTLTLKSVARLKILYTNNLGVFVGRTVPVVGEMLLAYDVTVISYRTVRHYNRLVKPEDQVLQ